MSAPGRPQSAEGAYREAHRSCPCHLPNVEMKAACGGVCSCSIGEEQGSVCGWSGHAAIDAALRALLVERGHVEHCKCFTSQYGGHHFNPDPRCARPAWLPADVLFKVRIDPTMPDNQIRICGRWVPRVH